MALVSTSVALVSNSFLNEKPMRMVFFLHVMFAIACHPFEAMAFAGFTHSCQLELSKAAQRFAVTRRVQTTNELSQALRKALSRDDAGTARLGRAVTKAAMTSNPSY